MEGLKKSPIQKRKVFLCFFGGREEIKKKEAREAVLAGKKERDDKSTRSTKSRNVLCLCASLSSNTSVYYMRCGICLLACALYIWRRVCTVCAPAMFHLSPFLPGTERSPHSFKDGDRRSARWKWKAGSSPARAHGGAHQVQSARPVCSRQVSTSLGFDSDRRPPCSLSAPSPTPHFFLFFLSPPSLLSCVYHIKVIRSFNCFHSHFLLSAAVAFIRRFRTPNLQI